MKPILRVGWTVLLAGVLASSCAPADPVQDILDERTRWNVELLSIGRRLDDGQFTISARLSGPVHSKLDQLTFRLEMYDADRALIGHEWRTVDLTEIERGGPEDLLLRVRDSPAEFDGLAINIVPTPTPEESAFIKELQQH